MESFSVARVSALALAFALLSSAPLFAAGSTDSPTDIEKRRLEIERQELELEREELRLQKQRLGLETEKKALDAEKNAAREVITIQLQGEVLFDFGKALIRERSEPTLEKLAAVIQQFPDGQVTIIGHTDSVGEPQKNLDLSAARAQAVRDWLVAKGKLAESAIAVEGRGETLPIAPNEAADGSDDPAGRQKNRRVEIKIAEVEKRSAEVEAAMKELGAEETAESLALDLSGDVLFEFGKAEILPDAEKMLAKVAVVLGQFPDGVVRIDGYTDAKGPEEANKVLSQQRAEAVKKWLAAETAIPPSAMTAKGLGEADPVAPNAKPDGSDDPDGRQKNRRVEIVLTK